VNAAPAGVGGVADASNYVTVPVNVNSIPQTVTVTLPSTDDYFGLWWGSVDTYNTLTFYDNGVEVASFTGSDIAPPANGNQTASSENLYVNFVGLPDFNSFSMTSSQYAFEADNIAVGFVPEPMSILLLGLGLLGVTGFTWKFSR
jgi:hypothetical protein